MNYRKILTTVIIFLITAISAYAQQIKVLPAFMVGVFTDDYKSNYTISELLWTQNVGSKYHVLKVNTQDQYIIAKNDLANKNDAGLYTRIDYIKLDKMEPYTWAYCYSEYKAVSESAAENGYKADQKNPRKGCNGFPFSRMQLLEKFK